MTRLGSSLFIYSLRTHEIPMLVMYHALNLVKTKMGMM